MDNNNQNTWKPAQQYATRDIFKTYGITEQEAKNYLETPEGQLYRQKLIKADPNASLDKIEDRAIEQIMSGRGRPLLETIHAGDTRIRLEPHGAKAFTTSPYFTTEAELDKASASGRSLPDYFGLPQKNHADYYDVYKTSAKRNTVVFSNTIARTSESGKIQEGGGNQKLILDRKEFGELNLYKTRIPAHAPTPRVSPAIVDPKSSTAQNVFGKHGKAARQNDPQGNTWEYNPNRPQAGWTRTVQTNEFDPELSAGSGIPVNKTQTLRADPELANRLSYQASSAAVELALPKAPEPKDPYVQPSADNKNATPWMRNPKTRTWSRTVIDNPAYYCYTPDQITDFESVMHRETADAAKAAQLDLAARRTIGENLANSPQGMAQRYQQAYEQNGWSRFGPMPPAVNTALKLPDHVVRTSDGHTSTRGANGQGTTPGALYGTNPVSEKIRQELNATQATRQQQERAAPNPAMAVPAQPQAPARMTVPASPHETRHTSPPPRALDGSARSPAPRPCHVPEREQAAYRAQPHPGYRTQRSATGQLHRRADDQSACGSHAPGYQHEVRGRSQRPHRRAHGGNLQGRSQEPGQQNRYDRYKPSGQYACRAFFPAVGAAHAGARSAALTAPNQGTAVARHAGGTMSMCLYQTR